MNEPGVDTSAWQGTIDWPTVARQGLTFAVTKCTEGTNFLDPTFVTNITAIRQQPGLIPGMYHYCRPGVNPGAEGAQREAAWFLSQAGWRRGEIIQCDFEDPQASGDLAGWNLVWLDRVASVTGASPLDYSYRDYINTRGGQDFAQVARTYGLWIAGSTGDPQPPWSGTAIWQDAGQSHFVNGISGAVDYDVFFGNRDQLLAYCGLGGEMTDDDRREIAAASVAKWFVDYAKRWPADAELQTWVALAVPGDGSFRLRAAYAGFIQWMDTGNAGIPWDWKDVTETTVEQDIAAALAKLPAGGPGGTSLAPHHHVSGEAVPDPPGA